MNNSVKVLMAKMVAIALLICLLGACSEEEQVNANEEYFYLKNIDGEAVTHLDVELIQPIYEDLVRIGREKDAANFLNTYDQKTGNAAKHHVVTRSAKTGSNARINSNFSYGYYVQDYAWSYGGDSPVQEDPYYYELGTVAQAKRLEAFYLLLQGVPLCYESYLQKIGWQGSQCNGEISGTTNEARRMEAIRIWITDGQGFVTYKSYLQDIGWESTWKTQGGISGTTGDSRRLEAFKLKIFLY